MANNRSKVLKVGDSSQIFTTLYATGDVAAKTAYQEHYDPANRQQQQRNGVPVWQISAISLTYGDLTVTVPSVTEPKLRTESPIVFTGLTIGAGPTGALWFSADSVKEISE